MPEPHPFQDHHLSASTSTGSMASAEQCVTLSMLIPFILNTLYADLGDRMHQILSVMVPPPPLLRSVLLADYLPIRDLQISSLPDCVPGAVVALMRAHPRRAPDIPVLPTRSNTPFPSPMFPLLSDPMAHPGVHRQREGIIPPMVPHRLGASSKRRRPTDPLAPLRLEYLVTPMISPPFRPRQNLTLP
jgi:hypothetical protein